MAVRLVWTGYVDAAMARATCDKLEDGSFAGRIPEGLGVIAFGSTLRERDTELRSTLEDSILLGLKLKHEIPMVVAMDLNKEPTAESLEWV